MRLSLLTYLAVSLIACAETRTPPASPAPAASSSESAAVGATEQQGDLRSHSALERELAVIDAELADIARRIQVAQEAAKAELQQQLVILQKREDDLRVQLKFTSDQADAATAKAHRAIQRAISVLDNDMKQLEQRLAP